MTAILSVKGVSRIFQSATGGPPTLALQSTDLTVQENDFITILGPSGCGKSTLLRIVAGLDQQSSGEVLLDGKRITGPGADRGMVFQSYTLFPWLTVLDNVCFGLRERGLPRTAQVEQARGFLAKVGLSSFENHYPKQLSGGMQQRTALARALANKPRMLLMDEPFGALDHQIHGQPRDGDERQARPHQAGSAGATAASAALFGENHAMPKNHLVWSLMRRSRPSTRGNIPSFIHISDGKTHEVNVMDDLVLESGALYLMDRGYLDFARLFVIHEAQTFAFRFLRR